MHENYRFYSSLNTTNLYNNLDHHIPTGCSAVQATNSAPVQLPSDAHERRVKGQYNM